jgi:hypothetical protein
VPVLALGGVLVVGVVLEAIHEIRVHPGASPAGPFFDDWLHDFLILTSAGVCAAGATRHTRDARAWTFVAIALLCIGMGEITWDLLYTHVDAASIPYPSLADAFDLASYPLFLAGLILIVRRRVPVIELHRWLDGIVIVLVVIAPMVALVLDPVLRQAPPDLIGQIVTLAYPFGDLVLLGTLLGALPMMSWRIDASWLLLGAGLLCLTIGDAAYAAAALDDAYHNGPVDFLWSAGSVAIAWAAWFPNAETRPPAEVFGWRAILLPSGPSSSPSAPRCSPISSRCRPPSGYSRSPFSRSAPRRSSSPDPVARRRLSCPLHRIPKRHQPSADKSHQPGAG